jgi:N-glycosidase YbiA
MPPPTKSRRRDPPSTGTAGTVERKVWAQVPTVLQEPMFYMSRAQAEFCRRTPGLHTIAFWGWVSQTQVSRALFGARGESYVRTTATHTGNFVWATEFANVHTSFAFDEPSIVVGSVRYNGSEHYFQLMKSLGTPSHSEAKLAMARATNPHEVWGVGRAFELRSDWEEVKVDIMRVAVRAKFSQNASLRALLLSTGDCPLVQLKLDDEFWGAGRDGSGCNMLGRVLMDLRQELRDSALPRLESEAVENGDGELRLNMDETVCMNVMPPLPGEQATKNPLSYTCLPLSYTWTPLPSRVRARAF